MRKIIIFISVILLPLAAFAQDTTLTVTQDGNVGIGTTTPEEKLHVSGGEVRVDGYRTWFTDANAQLRLGNFSSNGTWWVGINGTPADNFFIFDVKTNKAPFNLVSGTGVAFFTGNVGIGTSTPQARLDVIGELRVTSATGIIKLSLQGTGEVSSSSRAIQMITKFFLKASVLMAPVALMRS